MYLIYVLFCMFVFSCSEISSALTRRRCYDCVSILSCESAMNLARRLSRSAVPPQKSHIFTDAICGTDSNNPELPKVCCSAFLMRLDGRIGDPIETHRNIGLLPLTSCGDIYGSRIIYGQTPMLYELPWMALISYITIGGLQFRCAGSVINSRYILTAAHCVTDGRQFKKIAGVRIGENDYSTNIDCQGDNENMVCEFRIQDIEVEEIIPHESFTGQQPVAGDIALLRLKEDIVMASEFLPDCGNAKRKGYDFSSLRNAAPICLPVYSDLRNTRLAGKTATIAGWGVTENQTESTKLLKAEIPILTDDNCSQYYDRYNYQRNSKIEDSFCAGDFKKDSCDGDSGGPLIMESDYDNQVRLVQYGIVSFGPKKCGSQFPGVYTDVSKYMEWILEKIRA